MEMVTVTDKSAHEMEAQQLRVRPVSSVPCPDVQIDGTVILPELPWKTDLCAFSSLSVHPCSLPWFVFRCSALFSHVLYTIFRSSHSWPQDCFSQLLKLLAVAFKFDVGFTHTKCLLGRRSCNKLTWRKKRVIYNKIKGSIPKQAWDFILILRGKQLF